MGIIQISRKTIVHILYDLHILLNSGCIPIKGGMVEIQKVVNDLFAQDNLDKNKIKGTWDKVKSICYSRATNSSFAGFRNFFSKSSLFGPGRDPLVDLIYNAIANIRTNLLNSNSKISNLFGLLNTHQKGRALYRLLPIVSKEDIKLINAIKKSLIFPHQTLNDIMQDEYKIFVSLYSPQKQSDFPKGKNIIISKNNPRPIQQGSICGEKYQASVNADVNFYAYYIKASNSKIKQVRLSSNEVPQKLQKIYHHLIQTKKEDDKEKNSKHYSHSTKEKQQVMKRSTDICFTLEERNKYDHIIMKCHDIYLNPRRCDVSETLKEHFIYKQIASYAEKLVQTLIESKLVKPVLRQSKRDLSHPELDRNSYSWSNFRQR